MTPPACANPANPASPTDTPLVHLAHHDQVAWITLDSPGNMNAMSLDLLGELEQAVDAVRDDPAVRCVVITGRGKAFSAGGDLHGFQHDLDAPTPQPFLERLRHGQRVFGKVEALPMPTVAGVNGVAVAGGLELVLCCDLVVAAASARLGDGHARYGIVPAGGASFRLPRKLGANRAHQLLLTGALLDAATLRDWGLVNEVVPDGELTDALDRLARTLAGNSPLGLRLTKALAAQSAGCSPDDAAEAEIRAFARYMDSEDLREGLAAFAARRQPVFTGR